MNVRPYTPDDASCLETLLRQIWGNDEWTCGYYRFGSDSPPDSPRFFRTVVSEEGGRPVGFGSAWTNPFHPHALYVSVNVHPAFRGRGFGTHLLEALTSLNTRRLPLQGCLWETSGDGVRFLKRNGFVEIRRTWNPILHVADVDIDALHRFEDCCTQHGYTIVSLASLAQSIDHEAKMAALLAEVYTRTHCSNPPRRMEIQGWVDLLRSDPPTQEATFLALQGTQCVGMSAAYREDPDRLALAWAGVTEEHLQHEREMVLALTLHQVSYAVGQGVTELQGEFDSTNRWAIMQMSAFPFLPAPCWMTFQRPSCMTRQAPTDQTVSAVKESF